MSALLLKVTGQSWPIAHGLHLKDLGILAALAMGGLATVLWNAALGWLIGHAVGFW